MKLAPVSPEDLRGVFAVPPLSRKVDTSRSIDFENSDLIVRHIGKGGITRFIYGGNAFLYHIKLYEFGRLLDWLSSFSGGLWAIPSIGPAYGRAIDQASMIRPYSFPCVMILPCSDPRNARGLERGYREIAEAAQAKLIIYLKQEANWGTDREAGLDAVGRLVDDGICIGIKYAVIRDDPSKDAYLEGLLKRVDRKFLISGIGERPAINHLRDWKLAGFTTGSGCVAPRLSQMIFESCARNDFDTAERLRAEFLPLEDLRDQWGPAEVLHFATGLAGIAKTGSVPPYLSDLSDEQVQTLAPVVNRLIADEERSSAAAPAAFDSNPTASSVRPYDV
jgi:dihydrodipicolinate synthase/N-acetylneuraminate lyase